MKRLWLILLGLLAVLLLISSVVAGFVAEGCSREKNCASLVTER